MSPTPAPADVLVLGAGLAGVVLTLELLSAGRRVTLLDRDTETALGGLAKESFGGILVVGTPEQRRSGVHDNPDLALQDWYAFGEFDPAAQSSWAGRWASAYVNESAERVYGWLKTQGIRFLPMPLWAERGDSTRGNSVPRWHVVWGTGQGLMRQLVQRLRSHPNRHLLSLHCGVRVDALLRSGAAVLGCRGTHEATQQSGEWQAAHVVVATGGINGSLEQVRRHWPAAWREPPLVLLNGAHPFADGRLHQAVQALGGQVLHLERMWNYAAGVHHWRPRKPDHGLSMVPSRSALWLNWRGERFSPPLVTGFDTRDLVTRICQQERAYSWQVLNRRIALKELSVSGAEFNPSIREHSQLGLLRDLLWGNRWLYQEMSAHCPDMVVAASLPELVDKMNALQGDSSVSLASVQAAAQHYDAQIDQGPPYADEQLRRIALLRQWRGDRLRTCNFQKILAPQAAPLIALRQFIISRKSLGGIQTDLDWRVLDAQGEPVPGLFAVGEAAGFGGGNANGLRALEGTFLGGCVLTARRCAAAL